MTSRTIIKFIDAVMDNFDWKDFIEVEVTVDDQDLHHVRVKDSEQIASILQFLWDTVIDPLTNQPIYSDAEIRILERERKLNRYRGI